MEKKLIGTTSRAHCGLGVGEDCCCSFARIEFSTVQCWLLYVVSGLEFENSMSDKRLAVVGSEHKTKSETRHNIVHILSISRLEMFYSHFYELLVKFLRNTFVWHS